MVPTDPTSRHRRPIEVMAWDPAAERAGLVAQSTVWVLGSSFVTALGVAMLALAQSPVGWILVGGSTGVGVIPWIRHAWRRRTGRRLEVWDLPPRLATLVVRAADQATRLHQLADRSPDGPVAEHLRRLALEADRYVIALHDDARRADPERGDPTVEHDMLLVVGQLTELTEAAGRLRLAQRQRLEASPLAELAERTDQLRSAIEHGGDPAALPALEHPTATDAGDGRRSPPSTP